MVITVMAPVVTPTVAPVVTPTVAPVVTPTVAPVVAVGITGVGRVAGAVITVTVAIMRATRSDYGDRN